MQKLKFDKKYISGRLIRYAHLNAAASAAPKAEILTRPRQKSNKQTSDKDSQIDKETFDFFLQQWTSQANLTDNLKIWRRRRNYCRSCDNCRQPDCNQCEFCLDKPKNGGEWVI